VTGQDGVACQANDTYSATLEHSTKQKS